MLTVLLATKDRSSVLASVLEAFTALEKPPGGWKMVVVDNGSSDDTKKVILSFAAQLPLQYAFESRKGKNHALNTGLSDVEGDLIVLTDDDVFPHHSWLVKLRAAADQNSAFSIFGGKVVPRWEVPPEDWLLNWVPQGPAFTLSNPLLMEGPTDSNNIFGPNMALRRQVFELGHRFDASIGPSGDSYPMGSETELVRRLERQGFKSYFCKDAIVEHFIRKSQMQESWLWSRATRFGRGQHRLASIIGGSAAPFPSILGVPRYMYRELISQVITYALACVTRNGEQKFHARWALNYVYGQMIEARCFSGIKKLGKAPEKPDHHLY